MTAQRLGPPQNLDTPSSAIADERHASWRWLRSSQSSRLDGSRRHSLTPPKREAAYRLVENEHFSTEALSRAMHYAAAAQAIATLRNDRKIRG
jgi:hypothetical protein